jgi:Ni/Fe-hydrogenase subunit HybB-like protein
MDLTNTQFVFESKLKRNLLIGVGIGVLCLALSAVGDDEFLTRFWSNYLHNSLFFTGIAFMAMFFMCAQFTAFAGWMTVIRRIWEAMSMFMVVGFVLMAVVAIGVWGHFHHLYHWNTPGLDDPNSPLFDKIIAGKKGFLNPVFYTIATLGFLAIWIFWARGYRKASVDQDTMETESWDYYKKQRKWAASFLPLGGFLSAVFLWQALMSIDSHWYSTMFAWYSTISVLLAAISLHIMLIIYLKSKGYLEYVSRDHLHDMGKFLFGISVFWTYLWFDQFMLIWYANNGEETVYFNERMMHYPVLFWGNLLLNFITPFFVLMRNDTKRKYGTLFFASLIVFFGHWWDYFYMIKPGVRIAAHEAKMIQTGGQHGSLKQDVAPLSLAEEQVPVVLAGVQDAHAAEAKPQEAGHGAEAKPAAEGETHGAQPAEAHGAEHAAPAAGSADHGAEAAHGDGHGDAHAADAHHGDKSFKLGYTIPGLPELGVMIGFLSLFLFFFFSNLEKASLVPLRDPYLEESLHHQTGAMIDSELEERGDHDDHH